MEKPLETESTKRERLSAMKVVNTDDEGKVALEVSRTSEEGKDEFPMSPKKGRPQLIKIVLFHKQLLLSGVEELIGPATTLCWVDPTPFWQLQALANLPEDRTCQTNSKAYKNRIY